MDLRPMNIAANAAMVMNQFRLTHGAGESSVDSTNHPGSAFENSQFHRHPFGWTGKRLLLDDASAQRDHPI